jgi:hypothetical protein
MIRSALVATTLVALSGCSMTIPSFYDDNESMLAVDVRMAVSQMTCEGDIKPQVVTVDNSIQRLSLYSESKGSDDVGEMVTLMKQTTEGMLKKETISEAYCGIKKKVLVKQSDDIADAVMWRY